MANKLKQLKIDLSVKSDDIPNNNNLHMDSKDLIFAEKHNGYYLIGILTKANSHLNPRIYLSYKHKVEYYLEKAKTNSAYKKKIRKNALEVFDIDKKYIDFIQDFIYKIFSNNILKFEETRKTLIGLSLFIKYLNKINKIYKTVDEIKNDELPKVYNYYSKLNKENIKCLFLFFTKLNMPIKQIKAAENNVEIVITKKHTEKSSISSILIYQIETYIKDDFLNTKKIVEQYWNWNEEFKSESFMNKDDLLKTFFDYIETYPNRKNNIFTQLLSKKLKYDFNLNVDFLLYSKIDIKNKFSSEKIHNLQVEINKLKDMSLNGRNLNIISKKYAYYWLKEIFPEYPFNNTVSVKYKEITNTKVKIIRRWISKYFNISLKLMDSKMYPQNNDIYPLYLLLLIKTGVNQEVLKNWEIKKNDKGVYSLLSDELDIFTIIDGTKERSNSNISVVLQNNSLEKKYLDFYIKWATPIYNNSENINFFQYLNNSGGLSKKYQEINHGFIADVKNSPTSFFKTYEIVDHKGVRVEALDHTQIRKSHNYQDFLKGKSEFERQIKKNHKSINTTKNYYENQNFEWEGSKKHKIALSQNLIVGIFRGEISKEDHKTASLFTVGPMADCKNNKCPTFDNAPILKNNEFCCDWTKCLTFCDKSCVISKIHGPVIISWINYMNNQRDEFLRNEDWEKEYLIDYEAAKDTLSHFTEDEITYSKKEAYKHDDFVKIKFLKTVKMKEYING